MAEWEHAAGSEGLGWDSGSKRAQPCGCAHRLLWCRPALVRKEDLEPKRPLPQAQAVLPRAGQGVGTEAGGDSREWQELCVKTLSQDGKNEQKENNYSVLANNASA